MGEIREKVLQDYHDQNKLYDSAITNEIFKNPYIRDLPNIAALHGMYSRFIVGEDDVYFAFGYKKEIVYGEFIEARDNMIPESVVNKCGYFVPKLDAPCVCHLDCETRKIKNDIEITVYDIITEMGIMDFYTARLFRHNMTVPSYMYMPQIGNTELNFVSMLDNASIRDSYTKASFELQESTILSSYLIPEWPISPKGKMPGSMGFSCSRYMHNTFDTDELQALYLHPERWENSFKNPRADGNWFFVNLNTKEEAHYILNGMKVMQIPCKIHHMNTEKNERRENALFRKSGLRKDIIDPVTIVFHKSDYGAFFYWQKKYIAETVFSKEQREQGKQLYYAPKVASFLFSLSLDMVPEFIERLKNNHIDFGYPEDCPKNLEFEPIVWMNVDISNMPRVLLHLNHFKTVRWAVHQTGIHFDSTREERRYAKMRFPAESPTTLYVTSNIPAANGQYTLQGHVMDMSGKLSKEKISKTFDPAQTPRCLPIDEVVKSKMIIKRPEWKK